MREKKAKKVLKQVQTTYNSIASEFSQSRQFMSKDLEIFTPYLHPNQKILDLGCGNGRLVNFLEAHLKQNPSFSFEYIGIDNSEGLLEQAKKNHPNYQFTTGDQLKIPLKDNSVDLILNVRAFHHIPSKKLRLRALNEMKRVLKPNGTLIITVWNLWQKKQLKHLVKAAGRSILSLGNYSYKDTYIPWGNQKEQRYYHAFTTNELNKLVQQTGFQIQETHDQKFFGGNEHSKEKDLAIIAQKTNERVKIMAIPFDKITLQQATNKLIEHIESQASQQLFVATPNPEMLLSADKDPEFKKLLQTTDLNIPDGFGIILTSKLTGTPLPERVTGTDLLQKICEQENKKAKIFLLGAAPGVAETAKKELEKKYKHLQIVGTLSGSPTSNQEAEIRKQINNSQANILFVAFGAPKQEFWIAKNLPHLPNVKVAMGVGGAFDFVAQVRKRAPTWMQKCGMEWLYRLIQEPKRIKRIINATLVFPIKFLVNRDKIKSNFNKK